MNAISELNTEFPKDPMMEIWKNHKGKILAAGTLTLTALVAYWYFSAGAASVVASAAVPKSTALVVVNPPNVSGPMCPLPPIYPIDKAQELKELFNPSSPTTYPMPTFFQALASNMAKHLKKGISTAGAATASLAKTLSSLPSAFATKPTAGNVTIPPTPTNSSSVSDWLPSLSWPGFQFETSFRTARIFTALTIFVLGQNNMLPQRMLDPLFR